MNQHPYSVAFCKGKKAKREDTNPYPYQSALHTHWQMGHTARHTGGEEFSRYVTFVRVVMAATLLIITGALFIGIM